jgi:hypothetical protein
MDEGLRRLQRQRSDPESQAKYARELIRSGIIDGCVNHICDIGEHFNHLEALGSSEDSSYAITQRRKLLSKVVGCLAPVKIYILMRMTDEGDQQPLGAFTTRDVALKWAAERAMEELGNWYYNVDEDMIFNNYTTMKIIKEYLIRLGAKDYISLSQKADFSDREM